MKVMLLNDTANRSAISAQGRITFVTIENLTSLFTLWKLKADFAFAFENEVRAERLAGARHKVRQQVGAAIREKLLKLRHVDWLAVLHLFQFESAALGFPLRI